MRRILLALAALLPMLLPGLDLNRAEYFFDADPGFGNAAPLAFTPGQDILINATLDIASLGNGLHKLVVRCRDADGKWSLNCTRLFMRTANALAPIAYLEYYIDTDPGLGNGVSLPFTGSNMVVCDVVVDGSSLSNGMHSLYVRAKAADGVWSHALRHFVLKTPLDVPDLHSICYYFDDDSAGIQTLPVVPIGGNEHETLMSFEIDCAALNLPAGMSVLNLWARDELGLCSHRMQRLFYYTPSAVSDLTRIGWYFTGADAAPEQVFWHPIQAPLEDVTLALAPTLSHLTEGNEYLLHLFAKDISGNISQEQLLPITVDFTPHNLVLTMNGNTVSLAWDEVPGAAYYKVKAMDSPGGAGLVHTVTGNSYNGGAAGEKKFYEVLAGDGSRGN